MKNILYFTAILFILSLASAQVCSSNYWVCWNQIVKNNNGQRQSPKPATNPTRSGITGTLSWKRLTTGLNTRANQYTYTLNQDPTCTIRCGLQSYPSYQNGFLYCKRDPYFWNGMKDSFNVAYTSLCIPTVSSSTSNACKAATNNVNMFQPSCNKNSLPQPFLSSGNDCCYDNNNPQRPTYGEQSNITPTTFYDNLVLPAYLYNAP